MPEGSPSLAIAAAAADLASMPQEVDVDNDLLVDADVDAADAAAAAAGDLESETDEARTKLENFKYYTSIALGTVCIVCIFLFLFLVPFVLDPHVSTLMHEFVDEPVTCKVASVNISHGKSNCHWTSCREGCTSELYVCYQVRVHYSRQGWEPGLAVGDVRDWVDLTRYDNVVNRTMADTPLLVNIKGCGYPPELDCKVFAMKYENLSDNMETFPCYYSKTNPWIVLETYNFLESMGFIVASIAIPNGIFIISLVVLLYW